MLVLLLFLIIIIIILVLYIHRPSFALELLSDEGWLERERGLGVRGHTNGNIYQISLV